MTNTLTTLGETFFTTGAKLVVNLLSRATGDSLTSRRKGATFELSFAWAHGVNPGEVANNHAAPPSSAVRRQENG